MMPTGMIKWFSPAKGYGFITRSDGTELFVHFSGLNNDQDRRLYPGDPVEFDETDGEKGLKAISVRRTGDGPHRPENIQEGE